MTARYGPTTGTPDQSLANPRRRSASQRKCLSAFFAGVYVPSQFLPDVVRTISDWTPLAAFRWALEDAWVGDPVRPEHLVTLAVTAVVSWLAAVRWFRTG